MESNSDVEEEHAETLQAPARQRKSSIRINNPIEMVKIDIAATSNTDELHVNGNKHASDQTSIDSGANDEHVTDIERVSMPVDEVKDKTKGERNDIDSSGLKKVAANQNRKLPTNDIVYDDTKPKRLPNPKKMRLSIDHDPEDVSTAKKPSPRTTLHDSISILISPDEPDSPTKRQRRLNMQSQDNNVSDESLVDEASHNTSLPDDTHVVVPDIEEGEHYQLSPKRTRRKPSNRTDAISNDHIPRCSSPVERLINKNGPHAVTSQIIRKHSSDARLVGNRDRVKPPPQRKVSLEARIEAHRYNDESAVIEQLRRRKVSFDTSALINGTRFMPLNDEIAVDDANVDGDMAYHNEDTYQTLSNNPGSQITDNVDDDQDDSPRVQSDLDSRLHRDDMYYDNEAYEYDDDNEDVMDTYAQGTHGDNDDGTPATIEHTHLPPTDKYNMNCSPSYTNGKVKRMSSVSEDNSPPKSILKVRKEDAESMISEDSIASGRNFKVRKDSIALVTDRDGAVQMQFLRKQYSNSWRSFGKKDIKQMWTNRHENIQKYKLHLFVLVLFSMTLAFVIVGLHFHREHYAKMEIAKRIFFDARKRELSIVDPLENDEFTAVLGQDIPLWQQPTHCYTNYKEIHDKTCLQWRNYARLNIAYTTIRNTSCYTIQWDFEPGVIPFDCFKLSDSYWYGPSNVSSSEWPLKSSRFSFSDSRSNFYGSGTFSHAFEYYWLSSTGSLVYVESKAPLEVNWNDKWHGHLCFVGHEQRVLRNIKMENNVTYTMCNGVNIRDTHDTISEKYLPRAKSLPKRYLLEKPHWSTVWDSSEFTVNESVVTNLANNIGKHGLECSTIEIDGKWEDHYGDLMFNEVAFPNIKTVFKDISNASCQASLNIYPYVSFQSEPFTSGNLTYDYFVKDNSKTVPALVKWQHELGAMIDVSNPKSREWLAGKLNNLSELYDLKTFRLSYGISDWFPYSPSFNVSDTTPNKLKFMFSELLAKFGETIVQSTSNSQNITTLIGISSDIETDPETGVSCLSNFIPDALNLGMAGYPFVMADGFAIEKKMTESPFELPPRSLFIRWMQISSFFPAMRYTVKPWSYDTDVVQLSKNLTQFHKDVIVKAFYEFEPNLLRGEPFIQPLWWIDPLDSETFTINDQFVVAGRYLVAPIFCENDSDTDRHTYRDIYVPRGVWMDKTRDGVARGPMWIRRYKVAKNTIPYFEKMFEIQNGHMHH